jgi:hypothetical protein
VEANRSGKATADAASPRPANRRPWHRPRVRALHGEQVLSVDVANGRDSTVGPHRIWFPA